MSEVDSQVNRWQTPELGTGIQSNVVGADESIEKALRKGFEEGRRQTIEQGQIELEAKIERFDELLAAFEQPLGRLDSRVISELSHLSVKIAEVILHSEIKTDPVIVERLVEEALSAVDRPEETVVQINPDDLEFLRTSGAIKRWDQISFESNTELARGGVLISSPETRVDATVEARLRQVLHDLLGEG